MRDYTIIGIAMFIGCACIFWGIWFCVCSSYDKIMLYNLIYYLLLFICVFFLLAIVVLARDKEHTTCRLAKQLLEDKTKSLYIRWRNYTQWNEYVPIGAGECPREIKCKYRPMKNHLH